jgi:hypothetical protein
MRVQVDQDPVALHPRYSRHTSGLDLIGRRLTAECREDALRQPPAHDGVGSRIFDLLAGEMLGRPI